MIYLFCVCYISDCFLARVALPCLSPIRICISIVICALFCIHVIVCFFRTLYIRFSTRWACCLVYASNFVLLWKCTIRRARCQRTLTVFTVYMYSTPCNVFVSTKKIIFIQLFYSPFIKINLKHTRNDYFKISLRL